MNIAKIALFLKKGNQSLFDYPVTKQYEYMDSLGEPKGDFDRSYKQFLCQDLYVPTWKKGLWWFVSFFSIPFILIIFYIKGFFVHYKNKAESVAHDWGRKNVFPDELTNKYDINWDAWHSGFCLNNRDFKYIFKKILGWRQPYFIFKVIMRIATYSPIITKYRPNNIIVNLEFSFCSSILTNYCHQRNVKHINVMHGEKLRYIRDSSEFWNLCLLLSRITNQSNIALIHDILICLCCASMLKILK